MLFNSTFLQYSDAEIPSTQAVMQELIFTMDGWGLEQAPWSTTSSGGDVKPIIDPGLRNQWLLYYIIIDGARKCHGQSTTYYLLCWIVSLVCVRLPCSALVFPYHVYLYCVQLAFIFLLWFHLGKWILVLFRGCKRNKFFQTFQWAQAEYQILDRAEVGLQERWSKEWREEWLSGPIQRNICFLQGTTFHT